MGLEIPNESREIVTLGEIIKSKAYDDMASPLALVLGKDIGGNPVVATSPACRTCWWRYHGSGKSTAVNAMVLSLLYKSSADQVRLIMIDPKMLELSVYEASRTCSRRRHRHEAGGQCAALVAWPRWSAATS